MKIFNLEKEKLCYLANLIKGFVEISIMCIRLNAHICSSDQFWITHTQVYIHNNIYGIYATKDYL